MPKPDPLPKGGFPPMDKKVDEKTKEVVVSRTEFIILLIWEEKFLGAEATAAAPKE